MPVMRQWNGTAWVDVVASPANMVTTDSDQTIAGTKTFNIAPIVPDGSFSQAKVLNLATDLASKYSATNPPPAPATMVTTDTAQTISAAKTFSVAPSVPVGAWSISNTTGLQSSLDDKYSPTNPPPAQPAPTNMVTTDTAQTISGAKTFTVAPAVPNAAFAISKISASGTPSASTFLRGDGSWSPVSSAAYATIAEEGTALTARTTLNFVGTMVTAADDVTNGRTNVTISAPTNMMTTDTGQTVSGNKTFTGVIELPDSTTVRGNKLYTNIEPCTMSVTGILSVQTGKSRIYLEHGYTIESIRASVNTAPAGASIIVDVNLNGTTIFSTQTNRPTIVAGANTGLWTTGAGTQTTVSAGQYITVDIDQVGSTTAGADLTVVIRLRRTS